MTEYEMKQLVAEALQAQAEATGFVIAAIARQLDANRLAADARQLLVEGKKLQMVSPLVERQAMLLLAAIDAEI